MLKKILNKPLIIEQLETLERRLLPTHCKVSKNKSDLAKAIAGFRGEQAIDYYLNFLPNGKYFALHDLRLPFNEKS